MEKSLEEYILYNEDIIISMIKKHQELNKSLNNNDIKNNLVIFDPEIIFDSNRHSYFDTVLKILENPTNHELNDSNILYLEGLEITNEYVKTELELNQTTNSVIQMDHCELVSYEIKDNPHYIYKHFNIINESTPEEIIQSIEKIKHLEKIIQEEKNKILNSDFVKSKLNNKIDNLETYSLMAKIFTFN